ncbi:MAG: alpha-galactosidase [Bacteroidales bacterium]|nr:alpha-galactosidase [Bacteroidales bacterium]
MKKTAILFFTIISAIALLFPGCKPKEIKIVSGNLEITIDNKMKSAVNSTFPGAEPFMDQPQPSEYLVTKHLTMLDFALTSFKEEENSDSIGKGKKFIVTGTFEKDDYSLEKQVIIRIYNGFPGMAVYNVRYRNTGNREIQVRQWINNHYEILSPNDQPRFWSFQGGTTNERKDWVLPIDKGFYQRNYLGMTSSDYGGGIPVTDIWRKDAGIAIGHTELVPRELSLPADMDKYSESIEIGVEYEYPGGLTLAENDILTTDETFVMVHQKDYFSSLQLFTRFMKAKGIRFAETEEDAYGSMWCAWGYERNFTLDEIIGTLSKVKELGIRWVGIDDGFQIAEGDWNLDPKKFPNGDIDMRRLVDQIHAQGLKAMIWWSPLAADPGSRILREDPDVLLYNEDWSPRYITWWDAWLMSPAYEGTRKHTREVLDMFLKTWDFDGIKIDGQHVNAVPADYQPDHGLENPEQCIEKLPEFFSMVLHHAREIKPNAVIEICPCGCCMSFHLMPYLNQAVSSDPKSSWQVRLKGKTYKAIIGQTAYYGDHVELMDNANDFATQMGIGAVMGTKFTWPEDNPKASASYLLTAEKEEIWKKWFGLYNQKMLPTGNYLGGLYDIGYDKPEGHVIQKGDTIFYAFYSPDWNGSIELRGLDAGGQYRVIDYVNSIDLGMVKGSKPIIDIGFKQYLLLEVYPE